MLNFILDIIWVVPSILMVSFVLYAAYKTPSKSELMEQQIEQLDSIRELLLRQELSKAIDKRREELANQKKQEELANQNKQEELANQNKQDEV